MGMIHYLPIRGNPELIRESSEAPTLTEMQEFVEGYIEHVNVLYKGKRTTMIVNDEGAVKGLPVNEAATKIYWAASAARGIDLADKEQREKDQNEFWAKFGNIPRIDLNPNPDQPPMIHGNAIVLEGIEMT